MLFRFFKFTILALITGVSLFQASFNDEDKLDELLKHYRENTPSERLYLHIDADYYQPGDTLWFSAYNRNFRKLQPSFSSNFLFISLIDPQGSEILRENFYLSRSRGKGDLLIPAGLPEGDYSLLAYTSWMKKGSPEDIFRRKVRIRKVIPSPFSFRTILNDSLYNPRDKVVMEVFAETSGNKILNGLRISWAVFSSGKKIDRGISTTNETGSARIEFEVPELDIPSSLLIELKSDFLEVSRKTLIHIPTSGSTLDIQFLPEGGNFISGIENTLAFKALNIIGEPIDFTGHLMDDKGNTIIDSIFTSFKGMGRFSFIPRASDEYRLVIDKPELYAGEYSLPTPDSSGLVLHTLNNGKNIEISITRTLDNAGLKDLILCGIINDSLVMEEIIPDNETLFIKSLETVDFPSGIICFCIMKNKQAISERRVFVNPEKQLQLELMPERKRYRARERVNLDILVKDHMGEPVEGSFSLSFANVQRHSSPESSLSNINSWFLLNSELKGDILEPDFYFSGKPGSTEALDLVMLINGWRGFSWEEVVRVRLENDFLNVNPESLRGKVETPRGKPVKRGNVTLLNTKIFGVEQTTTDKDGNFSFTPSQFLLVNLGDMTISAETSSGNKNVLVSVQEPFHDSLLELYSFKREESSASNNEQTHANIIDVDLDQPIRSFDNPVDITYGYFQFEEVSVKAGRQVLNVSYEEMSETVMKLEKEGEALSPVTSNSFIDILRQVDPGFTISNGGKILFRGNNSLYSQNQSGALLVLNGMPIGDNINQLDFVEPSSIDKIVITKNASAALKYRGGYLSGLIEITTKDDIVYKETGADLREKNITTVRGFRLSKSFYSPDYSRIKRKDYLDIRSTIYWNPDIQTDTDGKARVSFYNPDVRSGVVGIIEGWSKDGKLLGTGKVFYEIY